MTISFIASLPDPLMQLFVPKTPKVSEPVAPPAPPAPVQAPPPPPSETEMGAGVAAQRRRNLLRFGVSQTMLVPPGTGLGASNSLLAPSQRLGG